MATATPPPAANAYAAAAAADPSLPTIYPKPVTVLVIGMAGSGKTTLIRMMAGMETPTSGDILLRQTRINDVPANKRPTCMVFQSLALFPRDKFTHVWLISPPARPDPALLRGLQPVWQSGTSVLYRVADPTPIATQEPR